jgi:mRNA degradation ribonuclease J1/J2
MIDGKGVGHLSGEYVIKARQIMAHDGVIVLVFPIDSSGALIGNVQIESRGFVYSSEVRSIHAKIIDRAKQLYKQLRSK